MKRSFDFLFSFLGLIIFSPIFLIIGLCIKLDSNGPILFKQKRVGRNSKLFSIIKFRTMIANHRDQNTITVSGDIRITRFGVFLRKSKLDELPELWNVLIGEMSFVGPRPDLPGYADKLAGENRKILELRPGITGPATLKYANEEYILNGKKNPSKYHDMVIYPDKTRINLDYYYNHNFFIDIKVIFATIFRSSYKYESQK